MIYKKLKNNWVRFYRNQDDENNNEVLCCMLRDDNDHLTIIEHNDSFYDYVSTLLIFVNDGEINRLPIYSKNRKYFIPSIANIGNPFGKFNMLEIFQNSRTKRLYIYSSYYEVGVVMVEKNE